MIKTLKIKLLIASILFCITNFFLLLKLIPKQQVNFIYTHTEQFNPNFLSLNSVDKLINYSDSVYLTFNKVSLDTSLYVNTLSEILKQRFYHGVAEYSISDNWILYFLGKYFWSHFSAIVIPNDILKHAEGLCSQQTIIFLKILKQKNISFRTIGIGGKDGPGHFLSEVYYNGDWHLYDIDKEPKWENTTIPNQSINYYKLNPDSLVKIYEGIVDSRLLSRMIENLTYGEKNSNPAKNMMLFHRLTKILLYLFPIYFLYLILKYTLKLRKYNSENP